ncbi:AI-2E family transporter [Chryseomicrobium sp. FSL W7-1435]|uniref:AI-2E family transporter n=1 Tax=Chryseomicrobium sp. FSL W7-1435 TaxID=2921704 RepID=UPI00315A9349
MKNTDRKYIYIMLFFCGLTLFLYYLTPIYTALFLAFTLAPLVTWTMRHKVLFSSCLLVIGFGIWKFTPLLQQELTFAFKGLLSLLHTLQSEMTGNFSTSSWTEKIVTQLESYLSAETVVSSIQLSSAFIMECALFLSLFLLALITFTKQPNWIIAWLPKRKQVSLRPVVQQAQTVTTLFFRNEFILIGVTWLASSLFLLVIQFPHAFLVGLGIAILDVIPFLGVSIFYLPLSFYFFTTSHTLEALLTLLFFFLLVLTRHLLEPLLWKQRVQLPALVVLLILSSSLLLLGVKGFLLIPICFVIAGYIQLEKEPVH